MLALLGPIGAQEMVMILVVALLLFGGRLPDVARSLGRSVADFKKGLRDMKGDFDVDTRAPYRPPQHLPPVSESEPEGTQPRSYEYDAPTSSEEDSGEPKP